MTGFLKRLLKPLIMFFEIFFRRTFTQPKSFFESFLSKDNQDFLRVLKIFWTILFDLFNPIFRRFFGKVNLIFIKSLSDLLIVVFQILFKTFRAISAFHIFFSKDFWNCNMPIFKQICFWWTLQFITSDSDLNVDF